MNYVLQSVKVLDFTQNTVLQNSYQLDRPKLLNAVTALTSAVFPVGSFTAKGVYLHEPVHGFNLNHWSTSGLEPEMPVTSVYSDPLNHVQ